MPTSHFHPPGSMATADNGRAEPKRERLDAVVAARGRTDDLVEVESKEAILQERAGAFRWPCRSVANCWAKAQAPGRPLVRPVLIGASPHNHQGSSLSDRRSRPGNSGGCYGIASHQRDRTKCS